MARENTKTERYRGITEIALFEAPTSPTETTTSGAAAYGDQVLDLTAVTGLADEDYLFVNSAAGLELIQINGTPATTDCPLMHQLELAHESGAAVTKVTKHVLGYPTRDGVGQSGSMSQSAIESAIASLPIGYVPGIAEISIAFALFGWNVENLQLMYGAPTKVQGDGTSATPWQGGVFADTVATAGTRVLRVTGVRADLKNFTVDYLDFTHTVSGTSQLGKDPASYPVAGNCNGIIKRIWS